MPIFPPKISLARIPTPIERLERLGREWEVDLRVKRDDLTGSTLGGNKVRKLEYLLADAVNQGGDTVITCGAVTSNHARATALAARALGLDAWLVLAGAPPAAADGNLQLDLLAGARVIYITWDEFHEHLGEVLSRLAEDLKQQGKKPYIIPTGGSNAVGILGYVEAAREIKDQCADLGWQPDCLVCAVGSGGTYAGLYLGNALESMAERVIGITVCQDADYFQPRILREASRAARMLQSGLTLDPGGITLVDGYAGAGYAKTSPEQLRLLRHAAEREGLILDPVYTGKAFAGVRGEIANGSIPRGSRVLFLHTGGIFGLSAFTGEMAGMWDSLTYWPDLY
ncbi:MAG: 1-aminocyclopropane-1-carboxylate deaminase/D-cysteine desulfhydrase [bacterium]